MSDTTKEDRPPSVPEGATQGGETEARWAWVEPTVWSERMLKALEEGVKGQQELLALAAVGDEPELARNMVTMGSRHRSISQNGPLFTTKWSL